MDAYREGLLLKLCIARSRVSIRNKRERQAPPVCGCLCVNKGSPPQAPMPCSVVLGVFYT